MKERTHRHGAGGVATVDCPGSIEEIDLERIIWDPEYRQAVKPLLGPVKSSEPSKSRTSGRRPMRPD